MRTSAVAVLALLVTVSFSVTVYYGRSGPPTARRGNASWTPSSQASLKLTAGGNFSPARLTAGQESASPAAPSTPSTGRASSTPSHLVLPTSNGSPDSPTSEHDLMEAASLWPAVGEGEAVEPLNWTVSPAHSHLPPSTSEPPDTAYRSPEAASSSSRSGSDARRSYMLTHTYGGQLTRAIKNMMMQQCWARDLVGGATLIEPFSSKSLLIHEPVLWSAVKSGHMVDAARFSDYFDLQFYNQVSEEKSGAPLVVWEEFLAKAPREMIIVSTPQAACETEVRRSATAGMDKSFKQFVQGLEAMRFVVNKVVTVDCRDADRGKHLVQHLMPFLFNTTLVFGSWRNYHVVDSWLHMEQHCDTSDKYPASRLRPSAKIQRHMENYKSSVLQANKTIAIMLRVERFLTLKSSGRSNETVDSCLKKTMSVYEGLRQQAQWVGSEPYLTLDIGRFGSGIMQTMDSVSRFGESLDEVTKLVTKFLVRIYNSRWKTITEWEDSFVQATGGVQERGYVAMLQRGIAVESDCLILMGGGSYQEVAATQYLEGHPSPTEQCLHTVCVATALTNSLSAARRKKAVVSQRP